jgi:UPF0716 family protein affecting phage T7 exclusion
VDGSGKGHVQSLILGAVLFIAAVVLWALGVIGDLLAAQRVMIQKTFERVRRIELELNVAPSHYESSASPSLDKSALPSVEKSPSPSVEDSNDEKDRSNPDTRDPTTRRQETKEPDKEPERVHL